ncbi:MAG: FtsX-like permease family protein [Actinobacteria bacterium]|nr:FtsX-like permease family protein [Actinomycetota bacterium]
MKFGYFLSETITNLKRNLLMTVAAISTVAISLLLLGGVQILGLVVNNVTGGLERKVEISAYFRENASAGEIEQLTRDLGKMPTVKDVVFISKEEAFEEYKEIYKDQPEFWQNIPEDSLPQSLRISLVDADFTEEVASSIRGAPGLDEVRYGGQIIDRLLQVNNLLTVITFSMSMILLVAAAALIANTIRLAIYARRDEIGIMKLVGATNWFIRIPFLFEGVFAAFVGAIIASLIMVGAQWAVFKNLGEQISFLGPVFSFSTGEIVTVVGILFAVGCGIGLVGSGLALRRFLEA